jgi:tetratricopeptide (TPR) repeat protein
MPSEHVRAMVERLRAGTEPSLDKAESLVELAFDLQRKPQSAADLHDALFLYEEAARFAEAHPLARARSLAGKGAALRRIPGGTAAELEEARAAFEAALPALNELGDLEERAEAEMTYGLVLQALANARLASLPDAVAAYQRALRFFASTTHPREFAILHNNLATAYLSMRLAPEKEGLREALAVQSFREALKVVTLLDDPGEYAMLQNNLGNALQSLRSSHPFENLARAVEAYDEALKVRTAHDMPQEHANTIANKANALMNLPDDPQNPDAGNPKNLFEAARLLQDASAMFEAHGVPERAEMVREVLDGIVKDLPADLREKLVTETP